MKSKTINQWSILKANQDNDNLLIWIEAFLIDRKAQNFSSGTLYFYESKLNLFYQFCDSQLITKIGDITAVQIREYLFWLANKDHNPGGVNCCYRALKTFLYWWENEVEPEDWKNPIRQVKQPKISIEPLEPVSINTIEALIDQIDKNSFFGARDYSIILFLIDTGIRASELCSIKLADYNQVTGEVLIRVGKGRKPRRVFIGRKTRKAIRSYLKKRSNDYDFLFTTEIGEPLTYWGLNEIIRRLARHAGIKKPGLHDFRRSFALNMLRNQVDIYSLSQLMGHADLQVLTRYLRQTGEDLKRAHEKGSPVDNFL